MKDLMAMMKAAGEMKAKMEQAQQALDDLRIEGRSGGGLVTVTLTGKGEMVGVKVDPSLLRPEDAGVVEDLIVAAHNDAKGKVEYEVANRMQEVTAGLPIPPGMKFPL